MIRLFNAFVKLTGLPAALLVFRTKVYYENKAAQGRRIKGAAVLVSNHTSVFDYAVYLFVFFTRTLRTLMAEVLFEKKLLALFLKLILRRHCRRLVCSQPQIQLSDLQFKACLRKTVHAFQIMHQIVLSGNII